MRFAAIAPDDSGLQTIHPATVRCAVVTPPGDEHGSLPAGVSDGFDRRRFLLGAGTVAGLIGAGVMPSFGDAAAAGVDSGASRFVPLARQVRLADTRKGPDGPYPYDDLRSVGQGRHIRVAVTGRVGVPSTASAAALTITVINGAADNYVTVYPTGISRPDVSNLNMSVMHEEVANLATVRLGSSGSVDVESFDDCTIIVDVAGYYEPVTEPVSDGRYVSLDPDRVLDSRYGGMVKLGAGDRAVVDLTSRIPADATAVVVNLTTTSTAARGHFTCFPIGVETVPDSSNLNVDGPDQTRAAAAVVRVGSADGRRGFHVWSRSGGHVIVDLLGYYTGSSAESSGDGLFVPANPVRIVDTRKPTPARLWRNWIVESALPAPAATSASAVVLNVTAVDALGWGYLTVSPARSYRWSPSRPPGSSSLNHTQRGQIVANQVISRITAEHGLSVYASEGCHVLIDYSGYFTGTPRTATTDAPSNPVPQSAGPEWLLRVPRLGLQSRVLEGNSVEITDAGHTWHWTGTGDMGQTANVALFAHRTDAGGPFRNLHLLEPGDAVEVVTSDNRLFEYEVVNRVLTSDERDDILNGSRAISPSSVALIACSRENFLPTSLDHRIVVNAKLVRWSEF